MMGWYQDGWGWGWSGAVGMLVMLGFWAVIVGLAVWVIVRTTRGNTTDARPVESPRDILDRRYARGEIDAAQYADARTAMEAPLGRPVG